MCQSAWHEVTVLLGWATLSLVELCPTLSDTVVVWTSRVILSSEEMFPSRKKPFFVLDIKAHHVWVSVVVIELHTFLTSAFYERQRAPGTQLCMWLDVPQSQCASSCEQYCPYPCQKSGSPLAPTASRFSDKVCCIVLCIHHHPHSFHYFLVLSVNSHCTP